MNEPVCPIDPHANAIEEWLLSDHAHNRSAPIMSASVKILRHLADLAEANLRIAETWKRRSDHCSGCHRDGEHTCRDAELLSG